MRQIIQKIKRKRVVRDAFWYTLANIVMQLSSLLGVLFVSRYLGPVNVGLYSFIQNYIAIFTTFLVALDTYAQWSLVKENDPISALYKYIKIKTIVTVFIIFVLVGISVFVLPPDLLQYLFIMLIPFFTSIFAPFIFVLQYQNQSKRVAIGMILSSIFLVMGKIGAVFAEAPLSVFILINSLDGIVLTILCVYYVSSQNKTVTQKIRVSDFINLGKNAVYPLIYLCTWYIVIKADQFFVPLYFDARSLGIYSSAVKVVEMSNVLVVIAQSLIIPRMVQISHPETDTKKMHYTILLYLGLGACATMMIELFAPLAVKILFGPQFTETTAVLRVYALSIPGLFVSYLFVAVALSKQNFKNLSIFSSVLTIITLGLLYFASRLDSLLAFAYVSVFIYTAGAFVSYVLWRNKYI